MQQKITFIGAGNMAYSLIGGLLQQGIAADNITATDLNTENLDKVGRLGVHTTSDNRAAVAQADVVLLAVKPQVMQTVCTDLAPALTGSNTVLISIAAGIPVNALQQWSGVNTVVRCMPNTPSLLGLGATGLFASSSCSNDQKTLAKTILNAVGITVWVASEAELDAVTAVSGSGPAYIFLLIEAMQAAAKAQGLNPDVANKLALQTALGAATMAANSDDAAAELRRKVTSPGGTTEQAIKHFEANHFQQLVADAMLACADHSRVMAQQFGDE